MEILTTEAYFEQFGALGLFAHSDAATIATAKEHLADFVPQVPIHPLQILSAVPDTVLLRDVYNFMDNAEQVAQMTAMIHPQPDGLLDFVATHSIEQGEELHPAVRLRAHVEAFNKYLEDAKIDSQFYPLIYPDDQGLYGPDQTWGIIYLPIETRYDPRLTSILRFSIGRHDWDSKQTKKIIKLLRDINLLPRNIPTKKIIEIGKASYANKATVVSILNTVTLELYAFDAERIYSPVEDYHELVSYFILWSKAQFEPSYWAVWYLSEDERHSQWDIKLAFRFGEQNYEVAIHYESDWVKTEFVNLINTALSDAKIDGQFYHLKSNDQIAQFLFLRQAQIDALLARGLVDLFDL